MSILNLTTENTVFGLDIGYETLKLVQLKKSNKNISLVGAAEIPLTERILEKDSFKNKAATANLIKEACKKAKPGPIRAKKIVSALPETFVFSKTIQMPKMSEEEYSNAIPVSAAQYLPIPPEEVYLDFQILIAHPKESLVDVLIVASPKKLVDQYVELANLARCELVALETKPIAVGRAVSVSTILSGVVIIEIGTEVSRLSIWDNNSIRLISSVNIGKNQIMESIGSAQPGSPLVNNSTISNLVEETINAIKYHQSRDFKPNPIKNILLCGSGANINGIKEFFAQEIKIETEIVGPKLSGKTILSTEYTTSYGLALRNEFE